MGGVIVDLHIVQRYAGESFNPCLQRIRQPGGVFFVLQRLSSFASCFPSLRRCLRSPVEMFPHVVLCVRAVLLVRSLSNLIDSSEKTKRVRKRDPFRYRKGSREKEGQKQTAVQKSKIEEENVPLVCYTCF